MGDGIAGVVDGVGTSARVNAPNGGTVDGISGDFFFSDRSVHRVRRATPLGALTTVAGDGTAGFLDGLGTAARVNAPASLAWRAQDRALLLADTSNHVIRVLAPPAAAGGALSVSLFAGRPGVAGAANGAALGDATFQSPTGVAVSPDGATVYVMATNELRAIFNGQVRVRRA